MIAKLSFVFLQLRSVTLWLTSVVSSMGPIAGMRSLSGRLRNFDSVVHPKRAENALRTRHLRLDFGIDVKYFLVEALNGLIQIFRQIGIVRSYLIG